MLSLLARISQLGRILSPVIVAGLSALILFFAWAYRSAYLAVSSEPISSWQIDHIADCGVVLTGGGGRIREGVDLLAQKRLRKLIISGVHPQAEWREIFSQWPLYQDILDRDVVLERKSKTTFGNAQQTRTLSEALICRDLLLITSHIHLPRALAVFRAEFGDSVPVIGRGIYVSPEGSSFQREIEAGKFMLYRLFGLI